MKKARKIHNYSTQGGITHYRVSGGPMMVTLHSKTLLSSTNPAEKPSTGFFIRSDPRNTKIKPIA